MMNPFGAKTNALSLEDDSTYKFSSSTTTSNNRDCSFIDLKLGRLGDLKDSKNSRIPVGPTVASSSESSAPLTPSNGMRLRASSQAAYCQVYGCNKDLTSSKEYHKRHKVCESHTKTSKVVVNGIEQRFCQQCSRFHLLAEFDDGKRSCRKRLAGHNERRRKPQVGIHFGRTGRPLHSFNGLLGGQYHGTALATTSFICQDILPNGLFHPTKYRTNEWCRRIKAEDRTEFNSPSVIPITNGHLHSKPILPSDELANMFPIFHDNIRHTATGSVFSDNTNHYSQEFGGQNSDSHSLVQSTSFGNENLTAFDTAPTILGFSGITESGCALSLLSYQSHNSSNNSSGTHMAYPLSKHCTSSHHIGGPVSDKLVGVSSQISAVALSNSFSSSTASSVEGGPLDPILLSDSSFSVNFGVTDGLYQGSHFINSRNHVSCENGTTMDLFQLSSQLERVERQRQSMNVKQENEVFGWPRITNRF
ncbi:hypothetical protein K2173_028311 [Erythroxylum novogranatense]|uniref:SBP-type domain-containing protein n=1 Tax=Erythroxylum novogranatense TaxID=1862640 RepID=A0AAV8U4I8_9ROSI|nr:hypothetical protein K2173_028311 [Erythroxylum novogranatense]